MVNKLVTALVNSPIPADVSRAPGDNLDSPSRPCSGAYFAHPICKSRLRKQMRISTYKYPIRSCGRSCGSAVSMLFPPCSNCTDFPREPLTDATGCRTMLLGSMSWRGRRAGPTGRWSWLCCWRPHHLRPLTVPSIQVPSFTPFHSYLPTTSYYFAKDRYITI